MNTYYDSPIGIIEITEVDEKIIAVSFVDESKESEHSQILDAAIEQLDEYFSHKRITFDLSLAPHGTDFQKRVWNELLTIRFGKTTSYLSMSRSLGDERAIRAVAAANGKNPIGIIIPCHRVIGSDGSLTGYAGGLWRKDWLLRYEGAIAQSELF